MACRLDMNGHRSPLLVKGDFPSLLSHEKVQGGRGGEEITIPRTNNAETCDGTNRTQFLPLMEMEMEIQESTAMVSIEPSIIPMIKSLGQFFTKAETADKTSDKSELSITEYESIIRSVLEELGVTPEPEESSDDSIMWAFCRGSAGIFVNLYKNDTLNNSLVLDIFIPLVKLPEENIIGLFNQCLTLNFYLVNCHLALKDDMIVLTNSRAALGLDREEFLQTVRIMGRMGDGLDDSLSTEFNAEMIGGE